MGQMDTHGGILLDFLGYSWRMNGRYEVCIKVLFQNMLNLSNNHG
jgi:hypothetical protein